MAKRLQRPQNKRRSAAVIAVAAAVALASVAVAFMLRRAEAQSDFTPAVVTCAVHEKVNGAEVTGSAASGSVKSDITAENTGSTTVFLRLRLSACWVDGTGKVTGTPSALPQITLRQNWLDGGNGLPCPWSRNRAPRRSVNLCGWEPLFRPPARLCTSR